MLNKTVKNKTFTYKYYKKRFNQYNEPHSTILTKGSWHLQLNVTSVTMICLDSSATALCLLIEKLLWHK